MTEQVINQNWKFRQVGKSEWLPATVPGCVHTDLFANGIIEDPFYRLVEKDVQWIEQEDWCYRTTFDIREEVLQNEVIEIVFEGLDTYASIYLNDVLLVNTDNMFRAWVVDCKSCIRAGHNELVVILKSPYKTALPLFNKWPYRLPANNDEGESRVSPFTRKAPYQYGWDWGPRLLTSGIWRPVYLRAYPTARIESVWFETSRVAIDIARLRVELEIHATRNLGGRLHILHEDRCLLAESVQLVKGENHMQLELEIPDPVLWWPSGMGERYLYKLETVLVIDDTAVDRFEERIGLRTIELVNQPDEWGKSFYFKVNGIPVFMKGANIIPVDYFVSGVTREQREKLVENAVLAGMNMLRAWGGAVYEDSYFYRLCDEQGILVWQDFMFACGMYPSGKEFLNSVRQEVIYNVKRLRNHPSIALWCGNNEILEGFHTWGWKDDLGDRAGDAFQAYEKVFHQLIPDTLQVLDTTRPYWPSSPMASWDQGPRLDSGDYHYWDIVKNIEQPLEVYEENVGRFMSEYGYKSYPCVETLRSFSLERDWNIRSEVLESHQGWVTGADLVERNVLSRMGKPIDFKSFVYLSQLVQAEAARIAIEAHRRAMPRCMGSLYWQLNDCWPAASWASVDYKGRWKAMHYQVRESFAPLLISPVIDRENYQVQVWVVSDALQDQNFTLTGKLTDFRGNILREMNCSVWVKANTSSMVYLVDLPEMAIPGTPGSSYLLFTLHSGENEVSRKIIYLSPVKELALETAPIETVFEQVEEGFLFRLKSPVLTKGVYIESKGFDCHFSHNFFDLLPNEEKEITCFCLDPAFLPGKHTRWVSVVDAME